MGTNTDDRLSARRWWVDYEGRIRLQREHPGEHWTALIPPTKAPPDFRHGEDIWMQLVVAPDGSARFVELALTEDGTGWTLVRVLDEDQALRIAAGKETHGVGLDDRGEPVTRERWA